jgi:hypothetical protein
VGDADVVKEAGKCACNGSLADTNRAGQHEDMCGCSLVCHDASILAFVILNGSLANNVRVRDISVRVILSEAKDHPP